MIHKIFSDIKWLIYLSIVLSSRIEKEQDKKSNRSSSVVIKLLKYKHIWHLKCDWYATDIQVIWICLCNCYTTVIYTTVMQHEWVRNRYIQPSPIIELLTDPNILLDPHKDVILMGVSCFFINHHHSTPAVTLSHLSLTHWPTITHNDTWQHKNLTSAAVWMCW